MHFKQIRRICRLEVKSSQEHSLHQGLAPHYLTPEESTAKTPPTASLRPRQLKLLLVKRPSIPIWLFLNTLDSMCFHMIPSNKTYQSVLLDMGGGGGGYITYIIFVMVINMIYNVDRIVE